MTQEQKQENKPVLPTPPTSNQNTREEKRQKLFALLGDQKQEAFKLLTSEENKQVTSGNSIKHKARILSGNYNRISILFDTLENLGVDVAEERNAVFGATIGFSPELPPYGLRGETLDFFKAQQQPKKEETPLMNKQNNSGSQEANT